VTGPTWPDPSADQPLSPPTSGTPDPIGEEPQRQPPGIQPSAFGGRDESRPYGTRDLSLVTQHSSLASRPCQWAYLGRVEYGAGLALQRGLLDARAAAAVPDTLLLLEHSPVLTLGRRGSRDDILVDEATLAAEGVAVYETNRGGLVTYHGPGQLVGYPITDLRALTGGDVVRYVTGLEETVIRALAGLGITAGRDPAHRGVWVGDAKIAAVGVAISRGVTMHGFALNLQPDPAHFALIRPCGITDRGVTSAAALLGQVVPLAECAVALAAAFGAVFDRQMVYDGAVAQAVPAARAAAGA
jgi:lipoyl(octanoyl) transferase